MTSNKKPIAHRKFDNGEEECNPLIKHLTKVAEKSKEFASDVYLHEELSYFAGLWHDLGKYRPEFQDYIYSVTEQENPENAHQEQEKIQKTTHAHAGAIHALKMDENYGALLAYVIAGHHAGLKDGDTLFYDLKVKKDYQQEYHSAFSECKKYNLEILDYTPPSDNNIFQGKKAFDISVWIRMLFSCLVDADRLDTEKFMNLADFNAREDHKISLQECAERFFANIQKLKDEKKDSPLAQIRQDIYKQCVKAGEEYDGAFFSLTVPTGGGKTLSSMAFALKYALKHKKQRIIYAIPFTSIIEQNAKIFRDIFDDTDHNIILEHHSNLDDTVSKEGVDKTYLKLAAQNWEAPIIVTTNVQFFESLFSAHPSSCRKLHNIANSVVILDEAQALPREFLKPITEMMKILAKDYNVSFVFCTATQPDFSPKEKIGFSAFKGIENIQEIMDNPNDLFQKEVFQRVRVTFPTDSHEKTSLKELVKKIDRTKDTLIIVNTRQAAQELFKHLKNCREDGYALKNLYHLSTLMCPAHRRKKLDDIKNKLKQETKKDKEGNYQPCIVVSTSLIEAGVDISFPVVYRESTGLDSIAQAAGRCNRENNLGHQGGEVIVFHGEKKPPRGVALDGLEVLDNIYNKIKNDPFFPEAFKKYFKKLYKSGLDSQGICERLSRVGCNKDNIPYIDKIPFKEIAEKFKLIENEGTVPVIVSYKEKDSDETSKTYIDILLSGKERDKKQKYNQRYYALKKLQKYTVNIYESDFKKIQSFMDKDMNIKAGLHILNGCYDDDIGVILEGTNFSQENCIVD